MSLFVSRYNCKIALLQYLKRTDKPLEKPSYITIKAELIMREPAAAIQQVNNIRITKTVGD